MSRPGQRLDGQRRVRETTLAQHSEDFFTGFHPKIEECLDDVPLQGRIRTRQGPTQVGLDIRQVFAEERFQGGQSRHLPAECFHFGNLAGQHMLSMGGPSPEAQGLMEDPNSQGVKAGPMIPKVFDQFPQTSLNHHLGRHAVAQSFQGPVQQPQGGSTQRRLGLAQIAKKTQKTDGLGREEMAQGIFPRGLGSTQQIRQTLRAVEAAESIGQVNPVPRLLDLVLGETAIQLTFEDAAGIFGSQFGQGPNLDDVLHARTEAGLDSLHLAALQQFAETDLDRLHGGLAELTSLKQVDVLAADRRQIFVQRRVSGKCAA